MYMYRCHTSYRSSVYMAKSLHSSCSFCTLGGMCAATLHGMSATKGDCQSSNVARSYKALPEVLSKQQAARAGCCDGMSSSL